MLLVVSTVEALITNTPVTDTYFIPLECPFIGALTVLDMKLQNLDRQLPKSKPLMGHSFRCCNLSSF